MDNRNNIHTPTTEAENEDEAREKLTPESLIVPVLTILSVLRLDSMHRGQSQQSGTCTARKTSVLGAGPTRAPKPSQASSTDLT